MDRIARFNVEPASPLCTKLILTLFSCSKAAITGSLAAKESCVMTVRVCAPVDGAFSLVGAAALVPGSDAGVGVDWALPAHPASKPARMTVVRMNEIRFMVSPSRSPW
ncbi:MAG TPA: hypothetical protein VHO48_06170, partial [Anaerolineaceae bacterium]|nr:hypothetical protein [Anaerolineaceae bacterium]